jgi:hypothetical protein
LNDWWNISRDLFRCYFFQLTVLYNSVVFWNIIFQSVVFLTTGSSHFMNSSSVLWNIWSKKKSTAPWKCISSKVKSRYYTLLFVLLPNIYFYMFCQVYYEYENTNSLPCTNRYFVSFSIICFLYLNTCLSFENYLTKLHCDTVLS